MIDSLEDWLEDALEPLDVPGLLEASEDVSGGLGTQPDTEEMAVEDEILGKAELPAVTSPPVELAAEIPVPETGPLLEIDPLPETTLSEAEPLPVIAMLPDAAVPDEESVAVIGTLPEKPLSGAEPLALPVILPDTALLEIEPLSVIEALPETSLVEGESPPVIEALPEAILLLVLDSLPGAIPPETVLLAVTEALPEESVPEAELLLVIDALPVNESLLEAEILSVIEALLDVDSVADGTEPGLLLEVSVLVALTDPELPSLDVVYDKERVLPPVSGVATTAPLLEASVAVPLVESELSLLVDTEGTAVEVAATDTAEDDDELGGGMGYGASVGIAGA